MTALNQNKATLANMENACNKGDQTACHMMPMAELAVAQMQTQATIEANQNSMAAAVAFMGVGNAMQSYAYARQAAMPINCTSMGMGYMVRTSCY
jgi:hypothetical protein